MFTVNFSPSSSSEPWKVKYLDVCHSPLLATEFELHISFLSLLRLVLVSWMCPLYCAVVAALVEETFTLIDKNASMLSPILNLTTSAGPDAELDRSSFLRVCGLTTISFVSAITGWICQGHNFVYIYLSQKQYICLLLMWIWMCACVHVCMCAWVCLSRKSPEVHVQSTTENSIQWHWNWNFLW